MGTEFGSVSRRKLLGALGLGAPLLSPLVRSALAQTTSAFPKRFIYFFTPNGTYPDEFWPTGSGTDFTFKRILAPLAPHKQDLIVVKGISNLLEGASEGDNHQQGVGGLLTNKALAAGLVAQGVSIDQFLAARIRPGSGPRSVELGVNIPDFATRISYSQPKVAVAPINSATLAFDQVFGGFTAPPVSGGVATPTPAAPAYNRRAPVLNAIKGDLSKVLGSLGGAEKAKIEQHIDALADLERSAISQDASSTYVIPGGVCRVPTREAIATTDVAGTARFHLRLIANAIACDRSRVFTFMMEKGGGGGGEGHLFDFLPGVPSTGHHRFSHFRTDASYPEPYIRINTWFAQQFADLLAMLKSIPEGNGTALDNTIVVWGQDLGEGDRHLRTDIPYVVAGKGGGRLKTGYYLDVGTTTSTGRRTGVSHGQILSAINNVMGVAGGTDFPLPPLAQLFA